MTDSTGDHVAEPKTLEVVFISKRVLRTVVQVGIPAFILFAAVLPQIIDALGLPADSEVRLWLLGAAAALTAVAAGLARVMAIPAVNAWLAKFGLASIPSSIVK